MIFWILFDRFIFIIYFIYICDNNNSLNLGLIKRPLFLIIVTDANMDFNWYCIILTGGMTFYQVFIFSFIPTSDTKASQSTQWEIIINYRSCIPPQTRLFDEVVICWCNLPCHLQCSSWYQVFVTFGRFYVSVVRHHLITHGAKNNPPYIIVSSKSRLLVI